MTPELTAAQVETLVRLAGTRWANLTVQVAADRASVGRPPGLGGREEARRPRGQKD